MSTETQSEAPGRWATERPVSHRLFLLGDGIGKSRSPGLHESEGRHAGLWLSYRTLDSKEWGITADDLPAVVAWAKESGFSGFNVTHPFKQAIIPYLDELSERAQQLGAVNTVILRDGKARGDNTDWCGFQDPFKARFPDAGKRPVVQIGAGGAGAAIAYALLDVGVPKLTIHDVREQSAIDLVKRMGELFGADRVAVGTDVATSLAGAEGIVNCTPIGMAAHPGCPIDPALLRPDLWVAEVIYLPIDTELLIRAREVGCQTIDGAGMAAAQAARAFEYFTGITPDSARMAETVRSMSV